MTPSPVGNRWTSASTRIADDAGGLPPPALMAIMRLPREATMFQRINPDDLNGRQKEIYNFQKSAALLAD